MYRKKFKKQDFKGWRYIDLIELAPSKRVLDLYPHLKRYPEFDRKKVKLVKLSFDKVLRYVMIYYSYNVLWHTVSEVSRRKKEAALLAGFRLSETTGTFGNHVEEILTCKNLSVNQLIIRFLRRENKKFMQLCVFEEAKAKQMQKLIDGIGDREKELTKVVIDNVKTLTEDIERLEKELLNEDKNEDLLETMYDEVDYNNLGISPEEIAELNKSNDIEKVIPDPYISKYDSSKVRRKLNSK